MKALLPFLKPTNLLFTFSLALLAATTPACSPQFDKAGLDNITNTGGQLTTLMGKATEPFGKHSAAVSKIQDEIAKATEHAAGQKRNTEIAKSWKVLGEELATPFFNRWKEKGILDKDYIKESVGQVGKSLDAIKKAEMAKKK